MKSKLFKKIFAVVLALSVVGIPTIPYASTSAEPTTLYKVEFPNVGTKVTDGTVADVNSAIQTANYNNSTATVVAGSSIVENGAAATYSVANNWMTIKPTADGVTTQTDVVLGTPVSVGEVTFTTTFENAAYNSRRLTINDTKIVASGNNNEGYMLMQVDGFPFEEAIKTVAYNETWYKKSPSYNMATVKIVASRATESQAWDIKGYDGETLLFTGTLPAEPITKFGICHANATASKTTKIYKLVAEGRVPVEAEPTPTPEPTPEPTPTPTPTPVIPEEPEIETNDETELCKLDGSVLTVDAVYDNTSALNAALTENGFTGATVVEKADGVNTYSVNGSKRLIAKGNAKMAVELQLDKAINKGEVTFNYAIDLTTNNNKYFAINDTKLVRTGNANLTGSGWLCQVDAFPFEESVKTVNTYGTWYLKNNPVITLKVVVSRDDAASTWAVKGYDGNTLVFTGTLPAEPITKFGLTTDAAGSEGFVIHSLSAVLSGNGAFKSVKVVNAAGAEIEDLSQGGDVTCVVNVKQAGGVLYAAIYSSGWKLLDVQSVVVTEAGEKELPFVGVAADDTQHMKLFYWTNTFKPIIGFMDPLNPMN